MRFVFFSFINEIRKFCQGIYQIMIHTGKFNSVIVQVQPLVPLSCPLARNHEIPAGKLMAKTVDKLSKFMLKEFLIIYSHWECHRPSIVMAYAPENLWWITKTSRWEVVWYTVRRIIDEARERERYIRENFNLYCTQSTAVMQIWKFVQGKRWQRVSNVNE